VDLSRAYDPEDPGTTLEIFWECPNSEFADYCPDTSQPSFSLTPQQRVEMRLAFDKEYNFTVFVRNPVSGKTQGNLNVSFSIEQPELTYETNLCPYFDLAETNEFIWLDSLEYAYLLFTNNITDTEMMAPYFKVACSGEEDESLKHSLVGAGVYMQTESPFNRSDLVLLKDGFTFMHDEILLMAK